MGQLEVPSHAVVAGSEGDSHGNDQPILLPA